jgi:hypothetical protein
MQSCGDLPGLHDEEIGAGENLLARILGGKISGAVSLVTGEGKNHARKLPYRDVCSAVGFCLRHTTSVV